ncbi:MAG: transglutaminase-like domain-containing protein [Microgenomates group bacterium]
MRNTKIKFFLLIGLFIWRLFFYSKPAIAADINTAYEVTYFVNKSGEKIDTNVVYSINFENLRSDIYISKFNLSFPSYFKINNLSAFSNQEEISPHISIDERRLKIDFDLKNIKIGKGEVNKLLIKFNQENLFKENGHVWEVMIPTIENEIIKDYKVVVNIPKIEEKKLSIAKPKPDSIAVKDERTIITWINPKTKIIYAVFGDKQIYQLLLTYNLHNEKPIPVFYEIAFPPDTMYQKVYLESIEPKINYFYTDDDGNFIGKILLLPNEKKKIVFNGIIEIFVSPRDEVKKASTSLFENQKKYLLSVNNSLWDLNENYLIKNLDSPYQIYQTVINTLDYNYNKLNKKIERLGAQKALSSPQLAVCTEYTDLFIALARENGIYAREIQGYGFSNDENLRPISLVSDVLHSWVEYFDQVKNIWIPMDPTWEDTSGIDYFNSFDLNHIAFVIHGKDPNYPYPAGMYKTEDSKDIIIKPISNLSNLTQKKGNLDFDFTVEKNNFYENNEYKAKLRVINNSNIYQWDVEIKLDGEKLFFPVKTYYIPYLVPFSTKEIIVPFKTNSNLKISLAKVIIRVKNLNQVYTFKIFPKYFFYFKYIILTVFILFVLLILIRYGIFNQKR